MVPHHDEESQPPVTIKTFSWFLKFGEELGILNTTDDELTLGIFNDWISLNLLDSNTNTSFNDFPNESYPPPTITVEFI